MSAAVRIEGTAWQDPRFALLGALLGVPEEFAVEVAIGRMAKLWAWCTEKNQLVISERIVCTILRSDAGADALIDAELGRREEGGIYVSGTRGRVEWLSKLRTNGKKGGRPKGKTDKTKRLPKTEPKANQTRTRREPEPNPLTPTLAPDLERSAAAAPARTRNEHSPEPSRGKTAAELWASYERLAAEHELPARPRMPGDEQAIYALFDAGWSPEQVEQGLAAVAARAAEHPSEREWWDGKRTWRPEVMREALAKVAAAAPAKGSPPPKQQDARVGRIEPAPNDSYPKTLEEMRARRDAF